MSPSMPCAAAHLPISTGSSVIERGRVRPPVADDERLRDVLRRLEVVLEVLRGDVLAAGRDDDVLLAVGDRDEPVRVDLGDVAGVQPAVRVEHLGRRLGILVVAREDGVAADQQLAVLGDPELEPGQRRADRSEAPALGRVRRRRRRALASGRSPRRSGSRSRRRTRRSPGRAARRPRSASAGGRRGERGSSRRRAGRRRRCFSFERPARPAAPASCALLDLAPDGERPVGQAALDAGRLVDRRRRRRCGSSRRPAARSAARSAAPSAAPSAVCSGSGQEGDRVADVRRRSGASAARSCARAGGRAASGRRRARSAGRWSITDDHRVVVAMADHAALRRPGRARRVDEREEVVLADRGDRVVERGRVLRLEDARPPPRAPAGRRTSARAGAAGSDPRSASTFAACAASSQSTPTDSEWSRMYAVVLRRAVRRRPARRRRRPGRARSRTATTRASSGRGSRTPRPCGHRARAGRSRGSRRARRPRPSRPRASGRRAGRGRRRRRGSARRRRARAVRSCVPCSMDGESTGARVQERRNRGRMRSVPESTEELMRTTWNGSLTFGLVSIPVGLAPATKPAARQSDVSFRLLHRECLTPIKQKRWCPKHDRELAPDEIVKGWEASKGQFVDRRGGRARGARGARRLALDRDLPLRARRGGRPDLARPHLLPRSRRDGRAAPALPAAARGDARDGHRRARPLRALGPRVALPRARERRRARARDAVPRRGRLLRRRDHRGGRRPRR